jgi:hypothetical protein
MVDEDEKSVNWEAIVFFAFWIGFLLGFVAGVCKNSIYEGPEFY